MSTLKIPTTIFSGFLGSGKTTIIMGLVDQLTEKGEKVAYIKNEIGDEDVDGKIIRGKNIRTKELLNGCICCTLVGPFINSVYELVSTVKPTRIIIEASGASDPSAIALMVSSHPLLERDGVIAVVDVLNFEGYIDLSHTARSQATFTDLIIFNKVELADEARKIAVVGYVRELNNQSPIIEAHQGNVDLDLVFGISSFHLSTLLEKKEQDSANHDHSHGGDNKHLQTDKIETFFHLTSKKFGYEELLNKLNQLPKNIIRVKGFVKLDDDSYSIVNKVGARSTVEKIDPSTLDVTDQDLKLVFIGFSILGFKDEVVGKFV